MTQTGVMLVLSNVAAGHDEAEFDAWYDLHVTEVLEVPGVVGATRYRLADAQLPGSELDHRYLVVYEIEADDLDGVRDRILATSGDRTHSPALELDPLPVTAIFARIRERVTPGST